VRCAGLEPPVRAPLAPGAGVGLLVPGTGLRGRQVQGYAVEVRGAEAGVEEREDVHEAVVGEVMDVCLHARGLRGEPEPPRLPRPSLASESPWQR